MIAIVTLSESGESPNLLTIISIFISMISVASKSFVLSAAASYNIKTLIFTWLCAVIDFFEYFLLFHGCSKLRIQTMIIMVIMIILTILLAMFFN